MKITSFNPLIVTSDAERVIRLFEELGFEKEHSIQLNTGKSDVTTVRMKNADGFHVDVSDAPVPRDMTLIRMNVDDFDQAQDFLKERGFVNSRGSSSLDTETNRSAMLTSPSGFAFDLCQHIRK